MLDMSLNIRKKGSKINLHHSCKDGANFPGIESMETGECKSNRPNLRLLECEYSESCYKGRTPAGSK
jgi:hypothetical protein